MIIRNLIDSDKNEVIDMMRVFYQSDAVLSNGSEDIFKSNVNACVNDNPYLEGFVFEHEGGKIIGYAMIAKSFSTEFGKRCIWIEDIYIKPEFRSMGIGTIFFEKLFSTYHDVVFRLEAEADNSQAIGLYKKSGFDIIPYLELIKK